MKARYLTVGLIALAAPLAAATDLAQAREFYRTNQFENAYQAAMRAHRADIASLPALYITAISACRIVARQTEGRALLVAYRGRTGVSEAQRNAADAQLNDCQTVVVVEPSPHPNGTIGQASTVIAVGSPAPKREYPPRTSIPKPGVTAQGHKINRE